MPFSGNSASFLCFLQAFYHFFLILRSSKLKVFCYSHEPKSFSALDFTLLFGFRISFTDLVTRSFSSSSLAGRLLVPWDFTRPALPPWAANQDDFMALDYACISLHEFISCSYPSRGHTGWVFPILFCILFRGFHGLIWLFALRQLGILMAFTRRFVFLFWWFPSPYV